MSTAGVRAWMRWTCVAWALGAILAIGCGDGDGGVTQDTAVTDTMVADTTPGDDADTVDDTTVTPDTDEGDATGAPDTDEGDATSTPDADAVGDTSDATGGDTVTPGPTLSVERFGIGRLMGTPIAITRLGRTLWMGTRGNPDPYAGNAYRGGLVRLDLDTGATSAMQAELPVGAYYPFGDEGPVPTAGAR